MNVWLPHEEFLGLTDRKEERRESITWGTAIACAAEMLNDLSKVQKSDRRIQ